VKANNVCIIGSVGALLLLALGCQSASPRPVINSHAIVRPVDANTPGRIEVKVQRVDEQGNPIAVIVRPAQLSLGNGAAPLFTATTTLNGFKIVETHGARQIELVER